jgi:hypothetical protein
MVAVNEVRMLLSAALSDTEVATAQMVNAKTVAEEAYRTIVHVQNTTVDLGPAATSLRDIIDHLESAIALRGKINDSITAYMNIL